MLVERSFPKNVCSTLPMISEHLGDTRHCFVGGPFEQLDHRPDLTQTCVVGRDALHDVAPEDVVRPTAEPDALLRLHPVADRDDDVETVVLDPVRLAVRGS